MNYSSKTGKVINKQEIVIVGCGVIGLTCAVLLQENGFSVKIIADKKPQDTTSNKAAAVWFPFGVDHKNDARIIDWCRQTYHKLEALEKVVDSCISFVKFAQVFETKKEFDENIEAGNLSWTTIPRGFLHPLNNLPEYYEYSYEVEVPLMNTKGYLAFLEGKLEHEIEIIDGLGHLSELYERHPRIINCTGIGAAKLVRDEKVYPTRGQVVVIKKPAGMNRSYVHIKEMPGQNPELTYVISRDEDCIIGGTAEKDNWGEDSNLDTTHDILKRCKKLQPLLNDLNEEDIIQVKVGLRPSRQKVKLAYESVSNGGGVIHNYGHGGAGFTMAWGCAKEVVKLALEHFYIKSNN